MHVQVSYTPVNTAGEMELVGNEGNESAVVGAGVVGMEGLEEDDSEDGETLI